MRLLASPTIAKELFMRKSTINTLLGLGVVALGGLAIKRSSSKVRGTLVAQAAKYLGPDLTSPGALSELIMKDRKLGPAKPSKRQQEKLTFREYMRGGVQTFETKFAPETSLKYLYIHGGACVLNLQAPQWKLIEKMHDRLGGEIIAPIYPLAPEATWRETMAALQAVYLDMAEQYDAENIVILGDSAGGTMALLLAQWLRDMAKPAPLCLVLFSPGFDLTASGGDQPALERNDPMLSIALMRKVGKMWAKDTPPSDPRISPLFANQEDLPPTLVFSGTYDILNSDARRLASGNKSVVHREYANMMHAWVLGPLREADQALDEAAAFIQKHYTAKDAAQAQ